MLAIAGAFVQEDDDDEAEEEEEREGRQRGARLYRSSGKHTHSQVATHRTAAVAARRRRLFTHAHTLHIHTDHNRCSVEH